MSRLLYLILFITLLLPCRLHAQTVDNSQLLQQAELDYNIGRFDEVVNALKDYTAYFSGTDKQKALRLIALCYLALDQEQEAEQYAQQLIEHNNYYTSVNDPIRFEEMVERIKSGRMATVTTASSVSESITEAPVPVTIITAEMIENLGYNKNLNQILAAYVPGMTEISIDGLDNMAMHGAFSAEQELILVMENGHRLNNRIFNSCPMDYAISTEKIDHIEVLRGPASSLYGNVALSAVVNIITKNGANIDGVKAKYGIGSFGTHKADLTAGTRFMDADILVWASIYRSDGQDRQARDSTEYSNMFNLPHLSTRHAYVDAYKDTPSYDIGLSFNLKGFNFMLSRKNSKKLYQYGHEGYYNYEPYKVFNGIKPGMGIENNHAELAYTRMLGNVSLHASVYGDWVTHNNYEPLGAEFDDDSMYDQYIKGAYAMNKMEEMAMGLNLRASTSYQLGSMNGDLLLGGQFEHFRMKEYSEGLGEGYTGAYQEFDILEDETPLHTEKSLSVYAQGKHRFTQQLILNAGLRYDVKYRALQSNAKAVSPRLALIYAPKASMSFKLAYSRAFVDMSYNNRILKYGTFSESGFLPQYLTALQLVMLGKVADWHLAYDVNLFYNNYENLYLLGFNENKKIFENEGTYKCVGLELNAKYSPHPLSVMLNFYWTKVVSAKNYYYSTDEKRIAAVPHIKANLNVAWKALERKHHKLKVYGNACYQGGKLLLDKRLDVSEDLSGEFHLKLIEYEYYLSPTVRLDAGVKYTCYEHLQLALDVENILDTDHFLTGPQYNMYPYYQRGRNVMASIAYTF